MSNKVKIKPKAGTENTVKFDIGEVVRDKLFALMKEEPPKDWRTVYVTGLGFPMSMSTDNLYTGINTLLLAFETASKGYGSKWWGTLKQVQERSGMDPITIKGRNGKDKVIYVHPERDYDHEIDPVTGLSRRKQDPTAPADPITGQRKDLPPVIERGVKVDGNGLREQSTMVVWWKSFLGDVHDAAGQPVVDPATGKNKKRTFGMWRYYKVYNADQIAWPDGLPAKFAPAERGPDFEPIAEAEKIVERYLNDGGPKLIRQRQDVAYYQPSTDVVNVPANENLRGTHEFYSTLFHELVHSTGHASRQDREGISAIVPAHKRGETYSFEELVAEFGAGMLCGHAGILDTLENSAAYLAHWAKFLTSNPKAVIQAASKAQYAVNLILGVKHEKGEGTVEAE